MPRTNQTAFDDILRDVIAIYQDFDKGISNKENHPLFIRALSNFNQTDSYQVDVAKVLGLHYERPEVAEIVFALIESARVYCAEFNKIMRDIYLRVDGSYRFHHNLIRAIAVSSASVFETSGSPIIFDLKNWKDELIFCESVLARYDVYSAEVIESIWSHVLWLNKTASDEQIKYTRSTIEAYESIIRKIKRNRTTKGQAH